MATVKSLQFKLKQLEAQVCRVKLAQKLLLYMYFMQYSYSIQTLTTDKLAIFFYPQETYWPNGNSPNDYFHRDNSSPVAHISRAFYAFDVFLVLSCDIGES